MNLERREFLGSLLAAGLDPSTIWSWVASSGAEIGRGQRRPGKNSIDSRQATQPEGWLSHPPMRPLPVASNREVDESHRAYYMALDGKDSNNGSSLATPWRTLAKAQSVMGPGDTLYVRGGRYWIWSSIAATFRWGSASGSPGSPITIRAFPGELVTFSAGYQEFFDGPDTAWEPVPARQGGVEGEYWSTRTYAIDPQHRIVAGNFGDSMIPFARYQRLEDFRSKNEFVKSTLKNEGYDPAGMYFGPGAIWNEATGRIHIRLAHTHVRALADHDYLNQGAGFNHNYAGVTDPRRIPLVVCRRASPGLNASHIRIQDIVFDGAETIEVGGTASQGLELEGIHVFAGTPPHGFRLTGAKATMTRCKLRGYDAPWHSRFTDKNRTERGVLAALRATDLTVSRCEFTDHHDGVVISPLVATADFNRNLLDNMNDDGLYLQPRHPSQIVHVYQNIFGATLSKLPYQDGGHDVTAEPGAGHYVFRNLFDLRRPIFSAPPALDQNRLNFRYGSLLQEHGRVTPANVFFYHNIIALFKRQRAYMAGLGEQYEESTRRVYNNILVQVEDKLQQRIRPAANGDFRGHSNIEWGLAGGPTAERPDDIYADPAFVAFHTDWRKPHDWRLRVASPAIDRGFEIPKTWPDPLRALDAGPPDIGAIPYDTTGTVLGPEAEL